MRRKFAVISQVRGGGVTNVVILEEEEEHFISSRNRFRVASTSYYILLAIYKRNVFQVRTVDLNTKLLRRV
jgi:hypothetical protein